MTPDQVIQKIVELLYQAKAMRWSIQDKGALLAAVKLQLQEKSAATAGRPSQ